MRSDEDSEAKADQAATEIVELVKQEGDAAITGSAHTPGHRCQRYSGAYTRGEWGDEQRGDTPGSSLLS
jgi:hypothetical protein